MARFTKALLLAKISREKAKEKATATSNSNTGDDKEKVSYPSLLYCYVCYCTQLKMKGYAFAVFFVCLEIRDGGM